MRKYLVVAGNIGAGKSSLVRLLADRLDCKPYYEPVGENPYLEDFYEDMRAWAFHSQLFFLGYRLRSQRELLPRAAIGSPGPLSLRGRGSLRPQPPGSRAR